MKNRILKAEISDLRIRVGCRVVLTRDCSYVFYSLQACLSLLASAMPQIKTGFPREKQGFTSPALLHDSPTMKAIRNPFFDSNERLSPLLLVLRIAWIYLGAFCHGNF